MTANVIVPPLKKASIVGLAVDCQVIKRTPSDSMCFNRISWRTETTSPIALDLEERVHVGGGLKELKEK